MCAEVSHSLLLAMLYFFFLLFPFPFSLPFHFIFLYFLLFPFFISPFVFLCIRVENGASEIIPDGSV